MPTLSISVTLTNAQNYVLQKEATKQSTTPEAILTTAATEQAKSLLAQFERDLLASVPTIWPKATDAEKAQLVAKFEEISAR